MEYITGEVSAVKGHGIGMMVEAEAPRCPECQLLLRRIKGKNSRPEMAVRRLVHALGFRYRLHQRRLPGSPDLVFVAKQKVIFVHGCFWHGHHCRASRHPKTRPQYWRMRFNKNRARDIRVVRQLRRQAWSVLTIWECQLRNVARLTTRIQRFLGSGPS